MTYELIIEYIAVAGILIAIIAYFVLPVAWVLLSKRCSGAEKFGWFIITLIFSWLGLALFLITRKREA